MTLNSDFQKLYVDGLIHLYELDASSLGAGILRFHGHIAFQDWENLLFNWFRRFNWRRLWQYWKDI